MNVTINKRKITALLVVISFLTVFSLTNGAGNVHFAPPSEGTWTINTDESIIGETLFLNASIDITADGSLTITNSTLTFNVTETNGLNIQVSGALTIANSIITVHNTSVMLPVSLLSGSSITIINSTLEYVDLYGEELIVSIDESTFNHCELSFKNDVSFAVTNTLFQYSTDALTLENVTGTFTQNSFTDVENGLHIKKTKPEHVIVDSINFHNVSGIGILVESSSFVSVEHSSFLNVSTGISSVGTSISVSYNNFDLVETGISLQKISSANIGNNTFTDANTGLYASQSKGILIENNAFTDSELGIQLLGASATISENSFENLTNGIDISQIQLGHVNANSFNQIAETAINLDTVQSVVVNENTINGSLDGIVVSNGRDNYIRDNVITNSGSGVNFMYTKSFEILSNTIINVSVGVYIAESIDGVCTANGVSNSKTGISLWSVSGLVIASNGIFEAETGISFVFSSYSRASGNSLENIEVGVEIFASKYIEIADNNLLLISKGILGIESYHPIISGNTFVNISEVAVHMDETNGFVVYHNNFMSITNNNFGDITNCLGKFEYPIDNVTTEGNYYEGVGLTSVLIDTVEIDGKTYEIRDDHPLSSPYVVQPNIEFVRSNATEPTDEDVVQVETQIFVPTGLVINVYIDYVLRNETTWRTEDITSSGEAIGQIGAIKIYHGFIPRMPYNMEVTYRIRVTYAGTEIISDNETYTVLSSPTTPVIISEPVVIHYYEFVGTDQTTTTTSTTVDKFEPGVSYVILVEVNNQTVDIAEKEGKRQVFIDMVIYDPVTDKTTNITDLFFYNSTTGIYSYELPSNYVEGTKITYKIGVEDVNGNTYWSIDEYTIQYHLETATKSGFDAASLSTIGGLLFLVQIVVVLRRRKNRNNE